MTIYPNSALRALALHTMMLDLPNHLQPTPDADSIFALVDRLGAVHLTHYRW